MDRKYKHGSSYSFMLLILFNNICYHSSYIAIFAMIIRREVMHDEQAKVPVAVEVT